MDLVLIKAAVCHFCGVKNYYPKKMIEQVHNQTVVKTLCLP